MAVHGSAKPFSIAMGKAAPKEASGAGVSHPQGKGLVHRGHTPSDPPNLVSVRIELAQQFDLFQAQ